MLDEFVTALVGAPFGLDGFVKIRALSGSASHLADKSALALRRAGAGVPDSVDAPPRAASKSYPVAERRVDARGELYIKFQGIDTPEAAKQLKGMEVVVPRSAAAPLSANEFYIEDLKGLAVQDEGGALLGHVSNVLEGGGGDLIEITLVSGGQRLVPFRSEFFGDIDLATGALVLRTLWVLE